MYRLFLTTIFFIVITKPCFADGDLKTVQEAWEESAIIFMGQVISIDTPANLFDIFSRQYKVVNFEVWEVFKAAHLLGNDVKNISVLADRLLNNDEWFELDSTYIVYLLKDPDSKFFYAPRYFRSGPLSYITGGDTIILRTFHDTITIPFNFQYPPVELIRQKQLSPDPIDDSHKPNFLLGLGLGFLAAGLLFLLLRKKIG